MKNLKIKLGLFSLLAILAVSLFLTSCEQDAIISNVNESTYSVLDEKFGNYEIVDIDNNEVWKSVKKQIHGEVNLDMRAATPPNSTLSDLSFKMNRIQVEADDFKMTLVGEGGEITEVQPPETHVMVGQLNDGIGEIMMGITEDNFRAEIIEDGDVYMVEPLSDYIKDAESNRYIKYNVNDIVNDKVYSCGLDSKDSHVETSQSIDDYITTTKAGNYIVEVSYLGDFELYEKLWSNTSSAFNWMYWRIVYGSRRYYLYNNFPVELRIKEARLYNFPGVHPATSVHNDQHFLIEWHQFVKRNSWFTKGDVNILFTGKDTTSPIVGDVVASAFANTICNSVYGDNGPVCYVEHQWDLYMVNNAVAHEVGHILGYGTGHSNSGFMISNASQHQMNQETKDAISNHLSSNGNCL